MQSKKGTVVTKQISEIKPGDSIIYEFKLQYVDYIELETEDYYGRIHFTKGGNALYYRNTDNILCFIPDPPETVFEVNSTSCDVVEMPLSYYPESTQRYLKNNESVAMIYNSKEEALSKATSLWLKECAARYENYLTWCKDENRPKVIPYKENV